MSQMWAGLIALLQRTNQDILRGQGYHLSFEIVAIEGEGIYWLMWTPDPRQIPPQTENQDLVGSVGNTLAGFNPRLRVVRLPEGPLKTHLTKTGQTMWLTFRASGPNHYPLKIDFERDPLLPLVRSFLTDANVTLAGCQLLIRPVDGWQTIVVLNEI